MAFAGEALGFAGEAWGFGAGEPLAFAFAFPFAASVAAGVGAFTLASDGECPMGSGGRAKRENNAMNRNRRARRRTEEARAIGYPANTTGEG